MKFRVEGIYDAKKLGIPQMLILGLQHMFAMFGATILVPILVNNYFHGEGLSIQVTLGLPEWISPRRENSCLPGSAPEW